MQNGFWSFASEPNLVDFPSLGVQLVGGVVEDGTAQDVSQFFGLAATGTVTIQSDVPEPSVGLLGCLGAGLCLLWRRRRS